uniref:Protein-lysine N-methyltransferase SMYD4 n=1 Tax=Timema bartmani TaxID=61472 RepID=A0A7R9EZ49_9NEOP|nr:unnamed protein product [Timema bartmani]
MTLTMRGETKRTATKSRGWRAPLHGLYRRASIVRTTRIANMLAGGVTTRKDGGNVVSEKTVQEPLEANTRLSKWITHCLSHGTHLKSESKSSICRNKGNNKYKLHDDEGSLELYTESVRYAPRGSSDLALAYANRSAVLLHMGYYQECLRDIDLALKNNYPQHLRHKLEARQGQCLAEQQRHNKSLSQQQITEMSQKDNKYVTENKKICSQEEMATQACSTNTSSRDCQQEHYIELPSVVHGENDKFPFASSALDIVYAYITFSNLNLVEMAISQIIYDKFKGRHVKTNRDIKIKEILFVEKPFAFVVLPDHYNVHCHHCCKSFIAPIPCWECSDALYCSEVCREESWEDYHHWECHGGLQLFHSVGIAHLGLRVVLRAGNLRSVRQKWEKLKDDVNLPGVDGTELRDKDDCYKSVYHLVSHLGEMERDDYLQYALTAALLTVYLRDQTDYFKEVTNKHTPSTGPTENHIQLRDALFFVGNLLHRHVAQLVCNGHAITKLHTAPGINSSQVVTECQVRVATAIYPSASMMNHSCDPNIINSFHDQYLIVRACKDIPKGHEYSIELGAPSINFKRKYPGWLKVCLFIAR